MGLFNTVIVQCNMCQEVVGFQSKANEGFTEWLVDDKNIPKDTIEDLSGQSEYCVCGNKITLLAQLRTEKVLVQIIE